MVQDVFRKNLSTYGVSFIADRLLAGHCVGTSYNHAQILTQTHQASKPEPSDHLFLITCIHITDLNCQMFILWLIYGALSTTGMNNALPESRM
jgi:hypothetical protein